MAVRGIGRNSMLAMGGLPFCVKLSFATAIEIGSVGVHFGPAAIPQ
jgi:hypothetical protein